MDSLHSQLQGFVDSWFDKQLTVSALPFHKNNVVLGFPILFFKPIAKANIVKGRGKYEVLLAVSGHSQALRGRDVP